MTDSTFNVSDEISLQDAIAAADAAGVGDTVTINVTGDITEGTDIYDAVTFQGHTESAPPDLFAINTKAQVAIEGNNHTLNANGQRGFFVYSGDVSIADLTIANAVATGGAGSVGPNAGGHFKIPTGDGGGGGGGGLGGGLFVAGPTQGSGGADVTISNVKFTNDSAVGGAGGTGYYNNLTYRYASYDNGAGGGLGGAGAGRGLGLGGGGVGSTANAAMGSTGNQTLPGNGIVLGAADSGGMNPADPIPGFPAGDYYYASLWGGGGASDSGGGVGGGSPTGNGAGPPGGFGGGGADGAGHGGYGGGGGEGGNGGFGGGGGQFASGGFGAGAGGTANTHRSGTYQSWYTTGGGGGGGLGAGGDIFVMHGGNLTIEGSLAQGTGTVQGGAGGPGAGNGQGLGQGIFLEGAAALTFAAPAGQVTEIAENIVDTGGQNSSVIFGTSALTGTVLVTAANTYTGATTVADGTLQLDGSLADSATQVNGGATLDGHGTLGAVTVDSGGTLLPGDSLSAAGVLTTGNLTLDSGSNYDVEMSGFTPGVNFGETVADGVIDLTGGGGAGATLNVQATADVTNAGTFGRTVTLIAGAGAAAVQGAFAGLAQGAAVSAGGANFTISYQAGASGDDVALIGPKTVTVTTAADLDAAIRGADAAVANTGALDIYVSGVIDETADLAAINLATGNTLTLIGENGATLDGGDKYRGLFVYSGQVDIQNLTIQNAHAVGGAGGADAGGGAGLGGGLFVAGTANGSANGGGHVTLENVVFAGDAATGGAGGAHSTFAPGGGGGLGGAGGTGKVGAGGGGIDGAGGVSGSNGDAYGGTGDVPGASSGGHGNGLVSFSGGASGGGGGGGVGGGGGGVGGHNAVAGSSDTSGIGGSGGFGGGGGAGVGYGNQRGGAGGFGGGGGGEGGVGGFGGGGGGLLKGNGGFGGGGGDGGGGDGGGGLGAGGDIFVQQGGSLTLVGGGLSGGAVKGGAGAGAAVGGSRFGTGIFLQGDQGVTLAAAAGATETVSDVITDQAANGGVGRGSVTVGTTADTGTVTLAATDTYTGATTVADGTLWVDGAIKSSATEVKGGATLGGEGTTGAVKVDAGGTLAPGDGPGASGILTVGNLLFASGAAYAVSLNAAGSTETVSTGTINLNSDGDAGATLALQVASGITPAVGQTFTLIANTGGAAITETFAGLAEGAAIERDGVTFALSYEGGGSGHDVALTVTKVTPLVTSFAALNAAITAADQVAAGTGKLEIDISGTIAESGDLAAIDLATGNSLRLVGVNDATLDGGGLHRGLFVYSGTVDISDLTIQNAHAVGGAGGGGAGGGAGLGGGLFVAGADNGSSNGGGQVTLENVTFTNDSATGGAGGNGNYGGGGGLGGAGGNGVSAGGGGGGGIGGGASGGSSSYGGGGIVVGAGPGGGEAYRLPNGGASAGGGGGGSPGAGNGGGGGVNGGAGDTSTGGDGGAGGFGGGGGGPSGGSDGGGGGGFGGGGGAAGFEGYGGAGGFGGGGGGGGSSFGGGGGAGGFGGGNGTNRFNAPFYSDVGGGGLGAGGDIFVQAGGSLVIEGGSLSGGAATKGVGSGGDGQAFASGIYLQGAANALTFDTQDPTSGAATTQTVADVIGDDVGSAAAAGYVNSGAYTPGQVSIVKSGVGTLTLSATNTFSGGATVTGGTLAIGSDGALGEGGALTLDNGATLDLFGAGNYAIAHAVTVAGDPTVEVDAGVKTISSVIADGASAGDIVKTGSGTLMLSGANTYSGGTVLDAGVLELAASTLFSRGALVSGPAGTAAIRFGGASTLQIDGAAIPAPGATFANSIVDFGAGDAIDIRGLSFASGASATLDGDTLDVSSNGETIHFALSNPAATQFYAYQDAAKGVLVNSDPACYRQGTRIATARGDVPIEALQPGDLALTRDGRWKPVVWIGRRRIECTRHPHPATVWPIRVEASAFGVGAPARDLWLSPGHFVFVDGLLLPIGALVNGATVAQDRVAEVTYYHVELDAHDIILAEGLAAESYIDTGNRAAFENGDAFVELHPDFAPKHWADTCRPLAFEGPSVEAAKARLLARAKELGRQVTGDPDMHIVADGCRFEPVDLGNRRWAFVLPAGCHDVALISRTFTPSQIDPKTSDSRSLGLGVGRLQIDGSNIDLRADLPSQGWFDWETSARLRWTTGRTALPAGARIIILTLFGDGRYWNGIRESGVPYANESERMHLAAAMTSKTRRNRSGRPWS